MGGERQKTRQARGIERRKPSTQTESGEKRDGGGKKDFLRRMEIGFGLINNCAS